MSQSEEDYSLTIQ